MIILEKNIFGISKLKNPKFILFFIENNRYLYKEMNPSTIVLGDDAMFNDHTVLNDYYVNVTKSIGQPDLLDVNEDIKNLFLAH